MSCMGAPVMAVGAIHGRVRSRRPGRLPGYAVCDGDEPAG
jgi:hypothetical protein